MSRLRVVASSVKVVREVKEDRNRSKIIKPPSPYVKAGEYAEPVAERSRRHRIEESLLRACISEGMTRDDILAIMGIRDDQYATIEKRLLANDGQRQLSLSSAHRFYIYCLQQEQCVRDLEFFVQQSYEAIDNWNKAAKLYGSPGVARKLLGAAPTNQAAILAIKAKSEILERTVRTGQDLGIVQKRAKEIRISGQLNLAALPTEQLRITLQKKLNQFEQLVEEGTLPNTYVKMLGAAGKSNGKSVSGGRFESEQTVVADAEFTETDTRSMDWED